MWQRYWDFYVGGEQLRRNASSYLVRRQKEPNDVYSERVSRVFYENYLGSCIDWYAATLFRRQPRITADSASSRTNEFFNEFVEDCDRRGTSLIEATRKAFIQALVFRESYLLIDFPRVADDTTSRAEEDALGKSRAYVASFGPQELTNWRTDAQGDYEWVVLRTEQTYQETVEQDELVRKRRWAVYDRENFRIYEQTSLVSSGDESGSKSENEAVLVDEGRHGLAEAGRVPLVKLSLTDGLWLGNKASLLQQEHFNKSNALSWALHMGLSGVSI